MAHRILYIPGFGDPHFNVIKKWDKHGVEMHMEPINWDDDETFEAKLARVTKKIDELADKNRKISLVGVSAGGSMAINAYIKRKELISGVVFICSKLRNAEGVREFWFQKHPAFRKSIFLSQANIERLTAEDKAKMLTLRSLFDRLIPAHDSQIPGVKNRVIPFKFHIPTIFLALTLFKGKTINFLKARAE